MACRELWSVVCCFSWLARLALLAPILHVATYNWPTIFVEDFVINRSECEVSSGQNVVVVSLQN